MNCSVCGNPNNVTHKRKSRLIGTVLFLCDFCYDKKNEPRHAVILVARRDGVEAVSDYLVSKRYHGEEIRAEEVLT